MTAPPARNTLSGTPTNAQFNAGIGALYDYTVGLLGAAGTPAAARAALDAVGLTGNETIAGVKTFTSTVSVSKQSGVDANPGFTAPTSGGAFSTMWARRGAPFLAASATTGSSYAPALAHQYEHNSAFAGVYSVGVLNHAAADPGSFVVHHIDQVGSNQSTWEFRGGTGEFVSNGGVIASGNITSTGGQFIGNGAGLTNVPASAIAGALNASGTAPIYACRAWVNFNGTGTVAIRASGNVSSITDNGVGDYTVNFTNAMPDANYAVNANTGISNGSVMQSVAIAASSISTDVAPTVSAVRIFTTAGGTTAFDFARIFVSVFR